MYTCHSTQVWKQSVSFKTILNYTPSLRTCLGEGGQGGRERGKGKETLQGRRGVLRKYVHSAVKNIAKKSL